MALAKVGAQSVMGPLLPRVADQIKEAISVKGRARPNCPEALQCVGVLAQALGSTWKIEATSLVQPMMSTGLSQPLVKTLQVPFSLCLWRQSLFACLQGHPNQVTLLDKVPTPESDKHTARHGLQFLSHVTSKLSKTKGAFAMYPKLFKN